VAAGGTETTFATGLSGSSSFTSVQPSPNQYIFTLYSVSGSTRTALSAVSVTGVPPATGTISATPNPCTITARGTTSATTITWSTLHVFPTRRSSDLVAAGGTETTFATGLSGSSSFTSVQPSPNQYIFTLYSVSGSTRTALSSVSVTGVPPATGTISAVPNP